MEIDRILKKISKYLFEYRRKNEITQYEMAHVIGLSISRYSEIERNMGHAGLALKTLLIIANLEHDSITDFFRTLESEKPISKVRGNEDPLTKHFEQLNKPQKTAFLKRVQKNNPKHKTIPNKLKWSVDLMNMMLEGKPEQLEEMELMILNYYMNQINKNADTKKAVKGRANKLIKNM
ncbi:MAG: helix-turn-helix transcriptional regulator [Oligoflexales bacterium]|nr:helix-turn-helix transcriptional regulator [Oligoflexales bacterium]